MEPANTEYLDALLSEVASEAHSQFTAEGISEDTVRLVRYGNLRYQNQEHTVEVQLPDGPIGPGTVRRIKSAFHEEFERQYNYRLQAPIELVGVHLVAVGCMGRLESEPLPEADRSIADALKSRCKVDCAEVGIEVEAPKEEGG
jgi:N-methylhydantoinase A